MAVRPDTREGARAMKAHDAAQTLAAGGIAPVGAVVDGERTSPVRARVYTVAPGEASATSGERVSGERVSGERVSGERVSGERVIVRLEADAVATGADAEMAALGFGPPAVSAPLGQTRFRTLGFPAWALVNGPPKVAAAALAVVEELREAKQLAVSRPGTAKLAFENIAAALTREAPVLLPTFWEEAGRAAAEAGSAALGAQCFERARQAERAHGLVRDPEEADAVFVEFALLGALSAKTLSQYGKDLVKAAGGAEAYRRFRAIVLKRAFGGMPPYSGMGKDLAALAKAAKLDVGAETAALARELLEGPGVARAPVEFWSAYAGAIVGLARGDAAVRARLRAIWPDPRGGTDETRAAFRANGWVQLLDDAGALADLPDDGLGAWISRLLRHAGTSPRILSLVAEKAPRLAATRQPIAVVVPRASWGVGLSIDLAERALELGIPLADPDDGDAFDPATMTRDPVRVSREPRYGAKLVEAVAAMIGDAGAERRMAGKTGVAVARRTWLAARIDELDGKPLPQIAEALDRLEAKTTAETFAPWPELLARLAAIEIADGLAVQLRGGVADELAWPAYERALARLSSGDQPVHLGGAFPALVMWNAQTALALDHTGVIAEHDLVYRPRDQRIASIWFLAGQFLVVTKDLEAYGDTAYWSAAPKDSFPLSAYLRVWSGNVPSVFSLPDGSVSLGGKAFRPGDTVLSGSAHWVSDGARRLWTREKATFVPYDPVRGAPLAGPPPAWLQWSRSAYVLYARASSLAPAPAGLTSSPLGLRDGLLGLRVRHDERATPATEAERIDGLRWSGPITPQHLVDWPGEAMPRPRPIDATGTERPAVVLHAPSGIPLATLNEHAWAARGWTLVPPAGFWHYLSPRDPAGSAALRVVTAETARALLAGAPLAGVTHPVLTRGIEGHVAYARELAARLAALVAARAATKVDAASEGLVGPAAQLRRIANALETGRATKLEDVELDVLAWVRHGRGIAMRAMSAVSPDDDRRAARELLRAIAGTVLAGDGAKLRLYTIGRGDRAEHWQTIVIENEGASTIAIHLGHRWALELSRDGVFRGPARCTVSDAADLAPGVGTAWIEALLARPDEALPLRSDLIEHVATAGGMNPAVAALLWVGAPNLHSSYRDFLGKPVREQLGLSLGDATRGQLTLRALDEETLLSLYDAAAPDRASERLAEDFADGLARAWARRFGDRPRVPDEVQISARRTLRLLPEAQDRMLAVLAGDRGGLPRFRLRTPQDLDEYGDARGPDAADVEDLMTAIGWAAMALPVGDPIRAGIPAVVDALRAAADDPEALWTMDALELPEGHAGRRAIQDLVPSGDDGALVVVETRESIAVAFRPAKLTASALKRAHQMTVVIDHLDSYHRNSATHDLRLAVHLRSPAFAAFATRGRETPVPAGGYEANPLVSVPALVAQVAKTKKLPLDAAALYLQTLALAEPTQRDVCTWNGWTTKHYAEVAARLVKGKLVVGGKRPRFGRPIFLRGAYSQEGQNLPMEDAKLPLYDLLSRHVPAEPVHLLFARAWKDRR